MKKLIAILLLLWGAGALGLWYWNDGRDRRASFRTLAVQRGDIRSTIDATGTIEPEEVVDVGTQVAGEIQSFGADPRDASKPISYGSPVEQGTVLARLDASLFKARRDQAEASVTRAEADLELATAKLRQAERELDRNTRLRQRDAASPQEYDTAKANFDAAKATVSVNKAAVAVAKANLEEAEVNLGHTTIRSPVKGVVLDRRVNIGQTVVASLNAPSLFLIAKDLSRLEIWAAVNEADVGAIRQGQEVRFTVSAFPSRVFHGRVHQIRLNASMTQNVVTYTVVVGVDNPDGKLLPYLTARLQFQVAERKSVLLVSNAALRWQPRPQHVAPEARARVAQAARTHRESLAETAPHAGDPERSGHGVVWVRQGDFVRPVEVRVGLNDGVQSEVESPDLADGSAVVVGVAQPGSGDDSASPFLPKLNDKKR